MCPVCIATAALVTTGVASAGGLTAIAIKKFRTKDKPSMPDEKSKEKS